MNRVSSRSAMIRNRRRSSRASVLPPQASDQWSRAREWHNPLRNFSLTRAIQLAESYPRGDYADLMWTLGAPFLGIETADADLSAILSRRCSALLEMDWNVTPEPGDDGDAEIAAEQAAAVTELMNGISNLYETIEHLQFALCRGFSLAEILEGADGTPVGLAPVDHWHVVRDGIYGGWRYNPEARQTSYQSLQASQDLPLDRFVLRQVRRPLGRIALIKYARSILSEADWGAYVERYGVPSGVVFMPPDVRPEDEAAYLAAAEDVANGGTGALPNASDYKPNSPDKGSGTAPFSEHLDYWTKKLVLVGTNGMLTMLAESGSGTLAGNAHADTFEQLARGDARSVSEILNRQLVIPFLQKRFPGQPILASWALAFREEVDSAAVVDDAVKLSGAGYAMDPAELSEKTGYKLQISQKSPSGEVVDPEKGRANPVQTPPDAPDGSAGVSDAEKVDPPLKIADSEKIRNREQSGTGEKGGPIDDLLSQVLSGSYAAWSEVLVQAVQEGAAEVPEAGVEDETETKEETDA